MWCGCRWTNVTGEPHHFSCRHDGRVHSPLSADHHTCTQLNPLKMHPADAKTEIKWPPTFRYCLFIPQMWRVTCCSLSGCRLPGKARSPERAGGKEEVLADPVGGGVLSQPQRRPQGPEGREPVAGRTHEHQDCRYCSNPVKEGSKLTY